MKWKIKVNLSPKEGDTRKRRKFAWFPTPVGNEMVWLETFGFTEKYTSTLKFDYKAKFPYHVFEWVEIDRYTLDYYP